MSSLELALVAAIDEIHMKLPFYGIRRIRGELLDAGFLVGRQHVATLMRTMGIEAIHPKRRLSVPHPGHKIYPYLLRGVDITAAGHVWCTDITYLPMARGFCYLVAIMDWASRRVLSWRLSNTLDASFCIEALEEALERYEAPGIFNTDQGAQFTSEGSRGPLRTSLESFVGMAAGLSLGHGHYRKPVSRKSGAADDAGSVDDMTRLSALQGWRGPERGSTCGRRN